ncbi:SagB/ThcOx family dehydrogenase [Azonexus sp. IMCC34839]|uniref:SagB/ThcOx family dehydrogenase n=1 Tax=Azonexus sp. IMCC34839 TaxID=3133695 RepID=UPI003999AB32
MSETPHTSPAPGELARAYHARTKHRFEAFAEGPGQLDWDAQPAAFRHYVGAPVLDLPLAAERFERSYGALPHKPKNEIAPDLASLSALLELSFGLSAWKSWGPSRWALRCNPSSGNLHPVEAYVFSAGLPGVADGLHHYDPEQHALEGRALRPPAGERWLAVGLSSVMWREAWKYGERAFRYCQLDVGHAVGALAYAAALLGWEIAPLARPGDELAAALGLDREADFPATRYAYTEREEPEILLALRAPGLGDPANDLPGWLAAADWQGQPSQIDPAPGYRWPVIDKTAAASRLLRCTPQNGQKPWAFPDYPPLPAHTTPHGAAELIRQRRSGQRFDPKTTLDKAAFYRLLEATLPRPLAPFSGQEAAPAIHLLLFVLRVDGLPPGLYLLPRTPDAGAAAEALGAADQRFAGRCLVADIDEACPPHLGLTLLGALGLQEVQRLARALSCHQDIAATSAFSLGMLADFATVADDYAYRALLREAGLIGQALYLEAEAAGVRGTGIGCFFDDPVHQAVGLTDPRWQSVYHFTVGTPIVDARLETSPPYPDKQRDQP